MRTAVLGQFFFFFFFFQAEDGIRDYKVTGVQTCALPISAAARRRAAAAARLQPAAFAPLRREPRRRRRRLPGPRERPRRRALPVGSAGQGPRGRDVSGHPRPLLSGRRNPPHVLTATSSLDLKTVAYRGRSERGSSGAVGRGARG